MLCKWQPPLKVMRYLSIQVKSPIVALKQVNLSLKEIESASCKNIKYTSRVEKVLSGGLGKKIIKPQLDKKN